MPEKYDFQQQRIQFPIEQNDGISVESGNYSMMSDDIITCRDIAYVVGSVSQFMRAPKAGHLNFVYRIS